MNKKSITRGFTLIELLVVIAIIGLLATIVLASISTARNKGADSHVQRQLNALRSQAEMYSSDNGNSYSGFCTNATTTNMLTTIRINSGITGGIVTSVSQAGSDTTITCHDAANNYVVDVPLRGATTTTAYCVDALGKTRFNTGSSHVLANALSCP